MKKSGTVLLCALSLFGCTTNKQAPSSAPAEPAVVQRSSSPEAAWAQRQKAFAQMLQWRLNGRVGLQLREQSWSFGLDWMQRGDGQYEMAINNPLTGSLMATVIENGQNVTLKSSDGKVYKDTDAERLLARQLKLNFPLKNMRYWARGVPSPNSPVEGVKLDAYGRPTTLQQLGWVIQYTAYESNSPHAMPSKVQLEKAAERVKVKLVAKKWQAN